MENFKSYIARQLMGKRLQFKCNCIIKLDVRGTIVDYSIVDDEIVFIVDIDGKIIKIGENHPNLTVIEA